MNQWKKNLYVTWVAETICLMAFSFVLPFLPYFIQELGIHNQESVALWSGFLGTATPLVMVISAPFWGALADKYGRKIMLTRAMFSGCLILALMAIVRTVGQLLVLRLVQGVLTGTFVAAVALVASQTPPENSGYSLGLMQTAVYAGSSLGPLLGGLASDIWGYRFSFLFSSLTLGLAALMILVGVEEKFMPRPENRTDDTSGAERFSPRFNLWLLLMVLLIFQLSGTIISPILPLFIQKMAFSSKYLASTAGSVLAAAAVASVFSAILVGKISDRTGHEKILLPLLFLAGSLMIIQAFSQSVRQLFFWRVAYGLVSGGIMPLVNSLINLASERQHLGKAFGLVGSISALGSGIGPVLGGTISSLLGIQAPFVFGGTLLLLSGLTFWGATTLLSPEKD